MLPIAGVAVKRCPRGPASAPGRRAFTEFRQRWPAPKRRCDRCERTRILGRHRRLRHEVKQLAAVTQQRMDYPPFGDGLSAVRSMPQAFLLPRGAPPLAPCIRETAPAL